MLTLFFHSIGLFGSTGICAQSAEPYIPKHLRELRDAIHLDQFKNQKELADHLGTDQSTVSRRMTNATQLGILTSDRIKDAYKLAKEKEVEFDEDDF